MRRLIALIMGEGRCPNCEGGLRSHEAGFHVCPNCSVVVDYSKGGWRFAGEPVLRRLPGVAGLPFEKPTEKAA